MDPLPRHYLRACLLLLITGGLRGPDGDPGPAYGYNLRQQLIELGVVHNDWARLYRTLRDMEAEGHLQSTWEHSDAGPSRRTYHVTEKGSAELERWAESMTEAQDLFDLFLSRLQVSGLGAA